MPMPDELWRRWRASIIAHEEAEPEAPPCDKSHLVGAHESQYRCTSDDEEGGQ